ncbi:hypothetical protein NVV95_11935 [Herbiconiux sp. CPCC 205716]|uniref:Secreted protein n=1 Tax=Herbiconiux gentiana TaxID=2970912 RepID=A0ABT2GGA1_9MICO|nr:hypothetical protein [Herbiconiux gentiana]MCS5715256.1 hypothetical protein [Herbiconiux gentiana]
MTKKPALILALALAVVLTPTLTSCANPVEQLVEGAVEQAGGGDVDLNSDGGLPDGFPSDEVPLADGEIVGGMGAGSVDSGGGWTVIVRVGDDREAAFTAIDEQLKAAGFEASYSGFVEGVGSGAYSDSAYSVIVSVADDGTGANTATYIVGGTSS